MALTVPKIPHPSAELVDSTSRTTRQWFLWFDDIQKAIDQRLPVTGTASLNGVAFVDVVFAVAEPNANYNVNVEVPETGRTAWVSAKTVNGFRINIVGGNGGATAYTWTVTRR